MRNVLSLLALGGSFKPQRQFVADLRSARGIRSQKRRKAGERHKTEGEKQTKAEAKMPHDDLHSGFFMKETQLLIVITVRPVEPF